MIEGLTFFERKAVAWLRDNTHLTKYESAEALGLTHNQVYRLLRLAGITAKRVKKTMSEEQKRCLDHIKDNVNKTVEQLSNDLGHPYSFIYALCKQNKIKVARTRGWKCKTRQVHMSKFFRVEAHENWLI